MAMNNKSESSNVIMVIAKVLEVTTLWVPHTFNISGMQDVKPIIAACDHMQLVMFKQQQHTRLSTYKSSQASRLVIQ